MKKKILGGFVVAAIAAVAAFNVNFNMNDGNDFSAISLANIEALAQGESGSGTEPCYTGTYDSSLPEAKKCSIECDKYDRVGGPVDKC